MSKLNNFLFLIGFIFSSVVLSDERISLNFKQIPLSEAFNTYADYTKQNVVIDSKLDEIVDMRLNNLTAKQILDVLVDMYDLQVIHKGTVLIIMRLSDYENRHKSKKTAVIPIHHLDVATLLTTLQIRSSGSMASASGGSAAGSSGGSNNQNSVEANLETNSIVLQGNSSFIQRTRSIIESLDKPQQQIKITAKLVSSSVTDIANLGLKVNSSIGDSNVSGLVNLGVAASSAFSFFISKAGYFLLQLELQALEELGKAEIVSAPSIFTLNNKLSTIQQGTQIPFQVQDQNGSFHTEFKDAVLKMDILPRYTGEEIILDVFVSKDNPSAAVSAGLTIDKRQLKTSVRLQSGQTVVLGGISDVLHNHITDRVPFLSDLPYIGGLFISNTDNKTDKQLVVFITPELVASAEKDKAK